MTITCKKCNFKIEERADVLKKVSFEYIKLIEHTKQTGHHTYKIEGLNMELNVG
jgi:hypothetical protein